MIKTKKQNKYDSGRITKKKKKDAAAAILFCFGMCGFQYIAHTSF